MSNDKKSIEEFLPSEEDEIFKILTHQIRRNIVKILGEHDLTFSQIKKRFDIDSPTLSYHLKNMKPLVVQKKSKYSFSEIGRAALFLLTKTDQSIKMSRYKRYFWYTYIVTYACWVFIGILIPILLVNIASIDLNIWILEIVLNIIAFTNMSVIGILKNRYI